MPMVISTRDFLTAEMSHEAPEDSGATKEMDKEMDKEMQKRTNMILSSQEAPRGYAKTGLSFAVSTCVKTSVN